MLLFKIYNNLEENRKEIENYIEYKYPLKKVIEKYKPLFIIIFFIILLYLINILKYNDDIETLKGGANKNLLTKEEKEMSIRKNLNITNSKNRRILSLKFRDSLNNKLKPITGPEKSFYISNKILSIIYMFFTSIQSLLKIRTNFNRYLTNKNQTGWQLIYNWLSLPMKIIIFILLIFVMFIIIIYVPLLFYLSALFLILKNIIFVLQTKI